MASLPFNFSFTCFLFFFLSYSISLSSSQLHYPESELAESLELTLPLPTSNLPDPLPECTLSLLNYTFIDTYNDTAALPSITIDYSPPSDCLGPWSHAVLHLSGAVYGEQYGGIAALWLDGVEILRTSTPQTYGNGTFWNVQKDITRYSSLLQQNVSLTLMLQDLYINEFNLTILYYKNSAIRAGNRKLGLGLGLGGGFGGVYDEPADLVIPVGDDVVYEPNWYRIEDESQVGSRSIMIPMNARKVVLELYVSSHGDDEFWYSNPPNNYILENNLTTTSGNGSFREVFVKIDGNIVASEVPFPVVYIGGINPLFWEPVVSIGAFDLPTYDFDLTPCLGSLLDGQSHTLEVGVTNAIKYWLVGANLHVWLDEASSVVQANVGVVKPPKFEQKIDYDFKKLDGSFEVEVERKSYALGWVASSYGNFTTSVEKKLKFKNKIKFQNNGAYKVVKQKVKVKIEVKILSETGSSIAQSSLKRKYPFKLIISTLPGPEVDSNLMITNLSQAFTEEYSNGQLSSSVSNTQDAGGWVILKNRAILSGVAETQQNLSYRSNSGCYTRSVKASGGSIVRDDSANLCTSLFHKVLNLFFGSW